MQAPQRKHPRLKEYDYSQSGCYFVTICTACRKNLLSRIAVGRDALIPPQVHLTKIGGITEKYIRSIGDVYDAVSVDKYVIMPNHIHLLISFSAPEPVSGGMRASRPTLHTVVRSLKTMVTREIGQSVWQTSYYDHIIRNEKDYLEIWQYIDGNPARWAEDELFASP